MNKNRLKIWINLSNHNKENVVYVQMCLGKVCQQYLTRRELLKN